MSAWATLGAHLVSPVIKSKHGLFEDELVVLGVLRQREEGRQARWQSRESLGLWRGDRERADPQEWGN